MNFQKLEEHTLNYMKKIGWNELTPIQKKAIPVILRKRNSLLIAPTGSGKTEAIIIPLFILLAIRKPQKKGVRALYVTPLRALNRDIFRRLIKYAEDIGLTADIRHGDTSQYIRQKMVEKPPNILITTPETFAIVLSSRKMQENLRTLEWIVVDELHELIGNERGAHLSVSMERAEQLAEERIVRVGLSATLGNVKEAGHYLAGKYRKVAVLIDQSARGSNIDLNYVDGTLLDLTNHIINYIRQKVGKEKSIILFANTRDEAEYLGALLKAKSPSIPVEVHHGSLSREIREYTENKLRDGTAGMVVSTSSLELGLDIGKVDLVIQVGSSRQAIKLIQRVGRSRHKVGETALGLIVTNSLDDELEALALINRIQRKSYEKSVIQEGALDVLAHHLAGMVIDNRRLNTIDALSLFKMAYPFRNIDYGQVKRCFELLDNQRVLRYYDEVGRIRGASTYRYYYSNVSTIPDIQQINVIDRVSDKKIGKLDQMFVGEYGEPGKSFILKGNSWRIISIDDDKGEVNVEPIFENISTIPYWVGELIPVDFETAREVGRIRKSIVSGNNVNVSKRQIKCILNSEEILKNIPDEKSIVIEKKIDSNVIIIHSCLGSKINHTLATMLSTIISSEIGYLVEAKSDPYRILLSSTGKLIIRHVTEFFKQDFDIETVLSVSIVGTHPLNWKTWYVAKKFGVIEKEAQYDKRASRLIQDRYRNTVVYEEVLRELFYEKYDLEKTKEVILAIKENRIKIYEKEVNNFSPIAQPILKHIAGFVALPQSIEKTILDLVKKRLDNGKHRLVCMSCGRWESVKKTKEIGLLIKCPVCKSQLIAETYSNDNEMIQLINRKKKGMKLSIQEEKKYRRAWKTSSLIQTFGNKAIVTLSGFGIGVDTAARILRNYSDEEEFYKNIYRAEKTYVSTRGFWND